MAPQLISFVQVQEVKMGLSTQPSAILWFRQNDGINMTFKK